MRADDEQVGKHPILVLLMATLLLPCFAVGFILGIAWDTVRVGHTAAMEFLEWLLGEKG